MSFQLGAGPTKYIYVDRKAIKRGEVGWVVECDGTRHITQKFTVMPDYWYETATCDTVESHGPPEPPLHPEGPALWLETTAAIEFG